MDLAVGDLRLRTLTCQDAPLLVEATRDETAPALWGPHPPGPYSSADAQAALAAWSTNQVSFGVLRNTVLVAALGLLPDAEDSVELAYWVRPDSRRQRIGLRGVRAVTHEA
jgi:RimJ/RimL family protein N-acetyltransferase